MQQQIQEERELSVLDIPDICNLIADFCDGDALLTLSSVHIHKYPFKLMCQQQQNKYLRKMSMEDNKDRKIRLLEFKHRKVCNLLDKLYYKIQTGQLIDLEAFGEKKKNTQYDQLDLYRKYVLNKYPASTFSNFMKLNQNLGKLMNKNKRAQYTSEIPKPTTGLEMNMISGASSFEGNGFEQNRQFFNYLGDAFKEEDQNLMIDDDVYEMLQRKRNEQISSYDKQVQKQKDLDIQCMNLMTKLNDSSTSLTDMVDGYVNYKINRYKYKLSSTFQKIRGDSIFEPEVLELQDDLIEPQYFFNSVSDKILQQHHYLLEPFKQRYAFREIKNIIVDRFGGCTESDQSIMNTIPTDLFSNTNGYNQNGYYSIQEKLQNNSNSFQQMNTEIKQQKEQFIQKESEQMMMEEQKQLNNILKEIRQFKNEFIVGSEQATPQKQHDYAQKLQMLEQKKHSDCSLKAAFQKAKSSPFILAMKIDPLNYQLYNFLKNRKNN